MTVPTTPHSAGDGDEPGDWQSLAWTLFLLDNLAAAGVTPASSVVVHRLQFFSNTLAPIYRTTPPVALVMKLKRGPFYPEAADDLDYLATAGLADISNIAWHPEGSGAWKTADYAITAEGLALSRTFMKQSLWCEQVSQFLHDLVFAYADVDDRVADQTAKVDLIYAQPGISSGSVIPFQTEMQNFAIRGSRELDAIFPTGFRPNRRNSLRLYLKYLEKLAA